MILFQSNPKPETLNPKPECWPQGYEDVLDSLAEHLKAHGPFDGLCLGLGSKLCCALLQL